MNVGAEHTVRGQAVLKALQKWESVVLSAKDTAYLELCSEVGMTPHEVSGILAGLNERRVVRRELVDHPDPPTSYVRNTWKYSSLGEPHPTVEGVAA